MRSLMALLLLFPAIAVAGLQPSGNGRYLVDDQSNPFLIVGDAPWSLIAQVDLQDAELYLQDRADRGFNLIMVNLIEHMFSSNPPANAYGDLPFTGTPFITPNEAYFAHADAVLNLAAQRGIVVLLAPVYLGYACGPEGWCADVENASLADMREWGRFVGERYGNLDGLIWLIGGDADPSPVADELREVVQGIRESDTVHLITAHNQPESQAISPWPGETWVQINSVYSYSTPVHVELRAAYDVSPIQPYFLLESAYENEGATLQQLRAQSYGAVLLGGFGHIFGNCPLWHFGYSTAWCGIDNWQFQLDRPGSFQMTYYGRLFESRHWYELVPDFDHTVLTSGYGTWGQEDYAPAAAASDGSSIIAYIPNPRTVTFDTSVLSGDSVRCWWYDPYLGTATSSGTFATGVLSFPPHPPDDWVIVIDDAALDLLPPGTPTSPTRVPEPQRVARGIRLEPNHPNPFNPATTIRFELSETTPVRVTIFNVTGGRVRSLLDETRESGMHEVIWDGTDDRGRPTGSGLYFCQLWTPHEATSRKMTLLE